MPSRTRAAEAGTAKSSRRTFADQLRELIRRRQSQYDLAEFSIARAAGIDHSSLRRFMSGERDWSITSAGRVADVLGISLVELRGGPPDLVPRLASRREAAEPTGNIHFTMAPEEVNADVEVNRKSKN